ncbi:hypothetical protein GCM10025734_08570 [Kitasatospora paranensis]
MNAGETAIQANDVPSRSSPVVTTARVPIRATRATPPSEPSAMVRATGRIRTPVESVP